MVYFLNIWFGTEFHFIEETACHNDSDFSGLRRISGAPTSRLKRASRIPLPCACCNDEKRWEYPSGFKGIRRF